MKKYAKVINEESKACEVGLGTNSVFYKSIGMTEMEVEQAYDGSWYLVGYAPVKPVETMQAEVRAVRNSYLEKYIDPKQLVLVWESLSVDERNIYSDYRRYLLDYTDNEDWYLSNPMTLDEYLVANENTIDNNSEKGDNELLIV